MNDYTGLEADGSIRGVLDADAADVNPQRPNRCTICQQLERPHEDLAHPFTPPAADVSERPESVEWLQAWAETFSPVGKPGLALRYAIRQMLHCRGNHDECKADDERSEGRREAVEALRPWMSLQHCDSCPAHPEKAAHVSGPCTCGLDAEIARLEGSDDVRVARNSATN